MTVIDVIQDLNALRELAEHEAILGIGERSTRSQASG